MKRPLGLLLLAGVLVCGARGSAVAIENSQDHSDGVAVDATGRATEVSAIRKTMAAERLAWGDLVLNSLGMVLVPIPVGEFQMAARRGEMAGNTTKPHIGSGLRNHSI